MESSKALMIVIQSILLLLGLSASSSKGATHNHQSLRIPDNSQVYDGPYIQVYPPVDLSQEQQNCSTASGGTCPLFIGLIMSFGGDYNSSGAVPGVQIALDQINADPTMLPGYTLHYTLTDSHCDRTTALDMLSALLLQPPTKIALIGSGCSVATEPTAEVSHYYNITQFSCVSSSSELSNRTKFRYYFQLLASEANLAFAFYGIIQEFGWRRVGLIVQQESLFTITMKQLKDRLTAENISYTETLFRSSEGVESLDERVFDPGTRVYLLAMYSSHCREMLCKAHQYRVQYPRYLFLVYGWYAEQWWVGSEEEQRTLLERYGCSVSDREAVLHRALAPLLAETISNLSATTSSGITGIEYLSTYEYYLAQHPLILTEHIYAEQCYDATWTLAYAMNTTLSSINSNESLQAFLREHSGMNIASSNDTFGLQHFTYNNSRLLKMIFSNVEQSSFNGITGPVTFKEDGVRRVELATVFSFQFKNDSQLQGVYLRHVADIDYANKTNVLFSFLTSEGEAGLWPLRPHDGVHIEEEDSIVLPVTVIFSLLATAGIIFAISCLIFNFVFRNKKLIRLSSPNLNNLIGIGAILNYAAIYCYVYPTTNAEAIPVLCNLTAWLSSLGYSLCLGTILGKMCRVYYIFNNPSLEKRNSVFYKDWMLALGVLLLVVIDLIILITYTAVEGARGNLAAQRVPNEEYPQDIVGELEIVYKHYIFVCDSYTRDIALGILYGLLQIIALILSFSIRKVKVKGLNDAKYIAAAIYVTSLVTVIVIVSSFAFKKFLHLYATVLSSGYLIGTTVILLLVFAPKMIHLYQDPKGEVVFSGGSANDSGADRTMQRRLSTALDPRDNGETVESLRKRVKELELELQSQREKGVSVGVNGRARSHSSIRKDRSHSRMCPIKE